MKRKFFLSILLLLMIFAFACGAEGAGYSYTNLTSEEVVDELCGLLSSHSVPAADIDIISGFVRAYGKESYAEKSLKSGWSAALILDRLYDYNEAINFYQESPFEDLSCREAAFVIYNSFLDMPESSAGDVETTEKIPSLGKDLSYYARYEILFGTFNSEKPVADAVKGYWKSKEIEFNGGSVRLVTLWGKENGEVTNLHCGVLIEDEEKLWFFEKTDPIMPYQLSTFDSVQDMKAYLLNRTEDYEDMTVLADDEAV